MKNYRMTSKESVTFVVLWLCTSIVDAPTQVLYWIVQICFVLSSLVLLSRLMSAVE